VFICLKFRKVRPVQDDDSIEDTALEIDSNIICVNVFLFFM